MSKKIQINQKTALVTGANRGIGKAIAEELLARGASKVYLGVRKLESADELVAKYQDRVQAVQLDVSNPESIYALPSEVHDIDILINNAGVLDYTPIDSDNAEQSLKDMLDVNLYGVIRLTNKLLPSLKQKSESALAIVGSVVSFANMPAIGTYSVSKAAVHSALQAYRAQLSDTSVLVSGIYPGPIDTDMAKDIEMDKTSPSHVAKAVADGLEAGEVYIFPDPFAVEAGNGYLSNPKQVESNFSEVK